MPGVTRAMSVLALAGAFALMARPAFAGADSDLLEATQNGDAERVATLLKIGVKANAADPDGTTALQWAAHFDHLEALNALLRAGARPNVANVYGVTPLAEAAANGDAAMIAVLLKNGANVDQASPEGETPLMFAARAGSVESVRMLLVGGAKADAREQWKGQTALMWAAALNHAEAAHALIAAGADPNARSTEWPPDLIQRPKNGNLVSERPKGGLTPLLFAAREGALASVRVLIDAKADLNVTEPGGTNALVIAIINAHYDVAAMLLNAGADPNIADKHGRTALYAATDMSSVEPSGTRPPPKESDENTAIDVMRIALERGANPNARLTSAVPGRSVSDDPDSVLRAGTTPFIRAAKTGDVAAMKLLLGHGADPRLVLKDNTTAMISAAGLGWRWGDSKIPEADALAAVKLCIELGLDVNAANDLGETPLHGAAARGATTIIQYLVDHGAKLETKDKRGRTPLAIAIGEEDRGNPGFPEAATLLRKLMADRGLKIDPARQAAISVLTAQ